MPPLASSPRHAVHLSLARVLLGLLGASLLAPVACGDDGADASSTPPGGSPGVDGGQGGSSTSGSAGKPSAGSSNGGSAQGGTHAQAGSATDGGLSGSGAPSSMAGESSGAGSPGSDGGAAGAGASVSSGGESAGAGGQTSTCDDVLDNAGCADASAATIDGQSAVFGGCVHVNQVSPGVGWVAYDSFGVDIESGLAFVQTAQIKSHDDIAAACAAMTVQGVSNWRLPTIDEARLLAGGCNPTAPGGSCTLSDPGCLGADCGFASPACESCLGNQGPHQSKGYCRPEVPFCLNAATSSACADCGTVGYWTYGIINGNFYSAKSSDQMFTICVKDNVPGALPCSL